MIKILLKLILSIPIFRISCLYCAQRIQRIFPKGTRNNQGPKTGFLKTGHRSLRWQIKTSFYCGTQLDFNKLSCVQNNLPLWCYVGVGLGLQGVFVHTNKKLVSPLSRLYNEVFNSLLWHYPPFDTSRLRIIFRFQTWKKLLDR